MSEEQADTRGDTLLIVTDRDAAAGAVVERGFGVDVAERVASAVDVGTLRANMVGFLEQVQEVLRTRPRDDSDFELSQVDFTAQITAEGKVCLLGSGGSVKAQGGIRFVLTRKPRADA